MSVVRYYNESIVNTKDINSSQYGCGYCCKAVVQALLNADDSLEIV
jgi:hypothetical protein